MLEAADGPIRMMIFGEYLLIALVVLRSGLSGQLTAAMISLIVTVSAYVAISGPWPDFGPTAEPVLIGLATLIPFALWNLSWHLFDDDFKQRRWHMGVASLVFVLGAGVSSLPDPAMLETVIRTGLRLAGIAVLAHAIWGIYRGLSDDLVERRRLARTVAMGLSILLVVSSLAVELALTEPADRAPLEPVNALLILLTSSLFAAAVLRASDMTFTAAPKAGPDDIGVPAPKQDLPPSLAGFIDGGGLFQSGLTVAGMADQVQMPEYLLRRTINGQLGFRNFNAFLNSHRIEAAKARLRDPALARQPILTIAMDLGYGSLGPFNRAFRAATDMTPSEWRQGTDQPG